MPYTTSPLLKEKFPDARLSWDLERLCADLTTIKQKPLSPTELVCLQALLCGLDPKEIAVMLNRQIQGLRVDLTRGVYRYVSALTVAQVKNWRDVALLLERSGYKKHL